MSELVGLSFDQAASPYLDFDDDPTSVVDRRNGWGVAWYPNGELGAAFIRDPTSGLTAGVTDVMADWGMLRTGLLVAHLRGAAKRATYRDTHPFVRNFAGRSWLIAHNGDLLGDLTKELPLDPHPSLKPIGPTDTEHLFCWLLGHLTAAGAETIEDFGFDNLAALLRQANELGTLNLLLADGSSLVAYHCTSGFQPLHAGRFVPPHPDGALELSRHGVSLRLGGHQDWNRSGVVISSVDFDDEHFVPIPAGTFVAVQGGRLVAPDGFGETKPEGPGAVSVPSPLALAPKALYRRLRVEHLTTYRYDQPVERSSHRLRLTPVHDKFQQVASHRVDVNVQGLRYDFEDVFGNDVIGVELDTPYVELTVAVSADVTVTAPVDHPDLLPRTQKLPVMWMPWQEHMMHSYLLPPELPESELEELHEYARSFAQRNRSELLSTLDDIAWTIYSDYSYKPGFTTLETTPYEVFSSRAGVCQDFANLMICLARMLNIPARYRVGYIYTGADYANRVQSDASHAWVEAFVPLMGWRGYDPTNGSRVGADHIRVAKGRNYRDATPTSGVIYLGGGGTETMSIDVRVTEAG